jgi:hypothetical protein
MRFSPAENDAKAGFIFNENIMLALFHGGCQNARPCAIAPHIRDGL